MALELAVNRQFLIETATVGNKLLEIRQSSWMPNLNCSKLTKGEVFSKNLSNYIFVFLANFFEFHKTFIQKTKMRVQVTQNSEKLKKHFWIFTKAEFTCLFNRSVMDKRTTHPPISGQGFSSFLAKFLPFFKVEYT